MRWFLNQINRVYRSYLLSIFSGIKNDMYREKNDSDVLVYAHFALGTGTFILLS